MTLSTANTRRVLIFISQEAHTSSFQILNDTRLEGSKKGIK